MIIHDLKNPLNIVLNFSKDQRVIFAGSQMLNLVHNLRDVQRYEHSEMKLQRNNVSLSNLLNDAVTQLNFQIEEKNIHFEMNQESDFTLFADKDIMNRVFVNLLSNALKFTPAEGKVSILVKEHKSLIEICIKDSGPGIPEDQRSLIFEKFGQFISRRSGKLGSSGLGLTFCKMAIEAHGGTINFISVLGKGTSFCVKLPINSNSKIAVEMPKEKYHFKTVYDIDFSEDEKLILKSIIDQLARVEIYEISKIRKLLISIEDSESENISLWIKDLQNAIWASNKEKFLQLVEMASK